MPNQIHNLSISHTSSPEDVAKAYATLKSVIERCEGQAVIAAHTTDGLSGNVRVVLDSTMGEVRTSERTVFYVVGDDVKFSNYLADISFMHLDSDVPGPKRPGDNIIRDLILAAYQWSQGDGDTEKLTSLAEEAAELDLYKIHYGDE